MHWKAREGRSGWRDKGVDQDRRDLICPSKELDLIS